MARTTARVSSLIIGFILMQRLVSVILPPTKQTLIHLGNAIVGVRELSTGPERRANTSFGHE